jgi:hypothetical protein
MPTRARPSLAAPGLAVSLIVLLLVPGVARAVAKPLPDLRASAVSAGAYARPGGPLQGRVRVAASRAARAGKSSVRFYLSADGRRSAGALRLIGKGATPALRGGARATVTARLTVPATVGAARYVVLACADDLRRVKERSERNNCAAAKTAVEIATEIVGAADLIGADLAAGRISRERSLVLRMLALFGDPRLPAQYQGDPNAEADDGITREIGNGWATLSPAAKRTLGPFMLPPAARGSWFNAKPGARARMAGGADDPCDSEQVRQPGWANVPAAGGKLRFWYRTSEADDKRTAQGYARDIGLTAYPRLQKLFGRDLLSDAGATCYHGPDGATDIYVVESIKGRLVGVTMPSDQSPNNNTNCSATPSFNAVEPGLGRWALAHELVHSFQFTYTYMGDCETYLFWDEATATWGANFVFPLDDYEHRFDSMLWLPTSTLDVTDYDGWVYALFLERTLGENVIPATYAQFATTGPITGIDAATGGFKARWKEFTKAGWNRAPALPSIQTWDRLYRAPTPTPREPLALSGAKKRSVPVPIHVLQLGRDYLGYPITDPKVEEVVFRNRMVGDPGASVWADLTFADGSERIEDWTDRKDVRFCRTSPGEDVQSIVLMVGNSEWKSERYFLEPTPPPSFDLRDTCGDDQPLRYEVLSASLHATTQGSQSVDQYCGSVSSTKTFEGQDSTLFFDAANKVVPIEAGKPALRGEIGTRVPAAWTHELHGCNDDKDPCSTTVTRSPGGDGKWPVSVLVEATSNDAPTATLTWAVDDPSVGFIDADPSVCNVTEFFQGLPNDARQQQVAMSTLRANGPTTLTLEGGPRSWNTDFTGDPAQLTYTWKYSMKLRRVDENGKPLS